MHGGFVQMTGDHLVVLSDLAELKDQIDVPRAEPAKRRAEETLARDPEDDEAQAALARAETRLKVAGHADPSLPAAARDVRTRSARRRTASARSASLCAACDGP